MRKHHLTREDAETLALQGLTFLAADGQRFARFLSMTGISSNDLKALADTSQLQVAVLDYLLADESLLLVFSTEAGTAPETVKPLRELLDGAGALKIAPGGRRSP